MAGPIVYDGTGLPPSPHRRRLAPRLEPEVVEPVVVPLPAPASEPFTATVEFSNVSPELFALMTGGGPGYEAPPQDTQEDAEQAPTEFPGEPADDDASSPEKGASASEDAGAATLAALGL
jgi:hypothetical protein